jgi:transcriptional regulator with XRE-family HTH domain
MKMLISRERLWQKICNDPDLDVDAGLPIAVFGDNGEAGAREEAPEDSGVELSPRAFLGAILREVRRREDLTLETFAGQIQVEVAELYGLEQDPKFRPRPRTIHKLAIRLSLPQAEVARLVGAVVVNDNEVQLESLRFAAKSEDLSTMTAVERAQLSALVDAIMARSKSHS